jgi:BMFP domain-containing protein YqiC
MKDNNTLNQLATDLLNALPDKIKNASADVKKIMLQTLQSGLQKMDLVTREEFEVQKKILARTREKLTALEQHVAELEKAADKK